MPDVRVSDAEALWREVVELREVVRRGHFPVPKIGRVLMKTRYGDGSVRVLEIAGVRQIDAETIQVEVFEP